MFMLIYIKMTEENFETFSQTLTNLTAGSLSPQRLIKTGEGGPV